MQADEPKSRKHAIAGFMVEVPLKETLLTSKADLLMKLDVRFCL